MKILYITTVGGTMPFFKTFIKELIDMGHIVDLACNESDMPVADYFKEWGCKVFHLSCERSPFKVGNLYAVKEIKQLVLENDYDIVHCHTPIAAACTRIACRKARKNGTKVIYTAHGFHFYKGAPLFNWMLFFPVEWLCSWWTDILITINNEDYLLANKLFHAKSTEHVNGVGIDLDRFLHLVIDKEKKREELGIPKDAIVLVSAGELNRNKNHEVIIKAIAEIPEKNIYYLVAGKGDYYDTLCRIIKESKLEKRVILLGHRNDIEEIYACADICAFPSLREGLGMAAIEGMAVGLPLVCGENRGTNEYAQHAYNAYVCKSGKVEEYAEAIHRLYKDKEMRQLMGQRAKSECLRFDIRVVNSKMKDIYF